MSSHPRHVEIAVDVCEEILFAIVERREHLERRQGRLVALRNALASAPPEIWRQSVERLIDDTRVDLALLADEVDLVSALTIYPRDVEEFMERAEPTLREITRRHAVLRQDPHARRELELVAG